MKHNRRKFLQLTASLAGGASALGMLPPSIRRALALPASGRTGSLLDVEHVVILMQENRSFDHYFGTLRGVRGFGDRHPVPLFSGRPVWFQSNGEKEIAPFHLDPKVSSALRVPSTPHTFSDAQAAWNQGSFGYWPKFKTPLSMGYYRREDIPFQFALAEAFTLCDAHHCSVTTGTDPNRVAFWSGSNFDPERRRRGENCTDADSEPNNLRCWIAGALPEPGYTYQGSALTWPTIPDVLEARGISWRIYQDPNDNWTGAMHGGLAFKSFREAKPDSSLYRKGMSHWSLEQLRQDSMSGNLPQVSWVLPPALWSEHPSPSSPPQGAEFASRVLEALTANPEGWGRTVFFLTFDENDGLFDHVPPPAPPSYNRDGTSAGAATLDLRGEYFHDPERKYLHDADLVSGNVRPWGLGPRVPLYVISPWSKGGWVNSQVFDHTSVAQFLERRFGVEISAISPWHRAVCGDLTSTLDFAAEADRTFPPLPAALDSASQVAEQRTRPKPQPPEKLETLYQEPGIRRARALPYELHVRARYLSDREAVALTFRNSGRVGAVFHVYDRLHLERIPRRYTVEAGKSSSDHWNIRPDAGSYDLWVYGPNGFIRELTGNFFDRSVPHPEVDLQYEPQGEQVVLHIHSDGDKDVLLTLKNDVYGTERAAQLRVPANQRVARGVSVVGSLSWYDVVLVGTHYTRRFAGRMESARHGFSDPAS